MQQKKVHEKSSLHDRHADTEMVGKGKMEGNLFLNLVSSSESFRQLSFTNADTV